MPASGFNKFRVAITLHVLTLAVCTALSLTLSGCSQQPEKPSVADLPVFKGEIGHFNKSEELAQFVFEHEHKTVNIDSFWSNARQQDLITAPDDTSVVLNILLWESCDDLGPGEAPCIDNCTGTGYTITTSSGKPYAGASYSSGKLTIRGYFDIVGCDGPHQGLMGCTLQALDDEEISRRFKL